MEYSYPLSTSLLRILSWTESGSLGRKGGMAIAIAMAMGTFFSFIECGSQRDGILWCTWNGNGNGMDWIVVAVQKGHLL